MSQKISSSSQSFILLLASIFLFDIVTSASSNDLEPNETAPQQNNLYYFAYGSNLLTDSIHRQNRIAINLGAALLKDYRLSFEEPSICWGGLCATIRPEKNATTYGVLYKVTPETVQTLDKQEMVPENIYFSFTVSVTWLDKGIEVPTFTYQLTDKPADQVPTDPRPSKTYLQCIIKGAQEARLPGEYIRFLKSFNHTEDVDPEIEELLQLQNVELDDWATDPLH